MLPLLRRDWQQTGTCQEAKRLPWKKEKKQEKLLLASPGRGAASSATQTLEHQAAR
jgi:hypothetical protein